MLNEFIVDHSLDVRGLMCPLPLLKMKQVLNTMTVGQVIHVLTTDSGSIKDFSSFVEQAGHELLRHEIVSNKGAEVGDEYHFWLKKCG